MPQQTQKQARTHPIGSCKPNDPRGHTHTRTVGGHSPLVGRPASQSPAMQPLKLEAGTLARDEGRIGCGAPRTHSAVNSDSRAARASCILRPARFRFRGQASCITIQIQRASITPESEPGAMRPDRDHPPAQDSVQDSRCRCWMMPPGCATYHDAGPPVVPWHSAIGAREAAGPRALPAIEARHPTSGIRIRTCPAERGGGARSANANSVFVALCALCRPPYRVEGAPQLHVSLRRTTPWTLPWILWRGAGPACTGIQ